MKNGQTYFKNLERVKHISSYKTDILDFLIEIYSIQSCTAITRNGVTRKKEYKKIKAYKKSVEKKPTDKKYLLILDLKPFRSGSKESIL